MKFSDYTKSLPEHVRKLIGRKARGLVAKIKRRHAKKGDREDD